MFTLNVSGNTVAELKDKVAELHAELNGNVIIDDLKIKPEKVIPEKPRKILAAVPETEVVKTQPEPAAPNPIHKIAASSAYGHMANPEPTESSFEGTDVSEFDKDGLPWDERLNSPLKVKDRFGRWKKRLGVSVEDRFRVIEELKGNIKTKPPEPEAAPLAPVLPDMNEPAFEVPAPTFAAAEPMPTAVQPAYEPSINLEHFKNNFSVVMSDLFSTKKITMEKVQQLCEIARVQQAWQIPTNETSLQAVYNNMVQERLL